MKHKLYLSLCAINVRNLFVDTEREDDTSETNFHELYSVIAKLERGFLI
jgi:hypothetical protein